MHSSSANTMFTAAALTEYYTLSLHDALPICVRRVVITDRRLPGRSEGERSELPHASIAIHGRDLPLGAIEHRIFQIRIRSEEHTSELHSQSNLVCPLLLEKKKQRQKLSMPIT